MAPYTAMVIGDLAAGERFHAAEHGSVASPTCSTTSSSPGHAIKVGFDPIIGLIPFVGDAVAAVVGSWVILEAARFGIPRVVLARMVVNLLGRPRDRPHPAHRRHVRHRVALELAEPRPLPSPRPRPGRDDRGHQAFFVGLALLIVGVIWLT